MNTLGINRPVYSFGLAKPGAFLATAWAEIVRFALFIRRAAGFDLER